MRETPWYDDLRRSWKPDRVRLLIIGESAPDDQGDPAQRHFFYSNALGPDNLFRAVALAMYGADASELRAHGKRPVLERLRQDRVYLIDLAPMPVNSSQAEHRRGLGHFVDDCVRRAAELEPQGIILAKKNVFTLLDAPLREAGLHVLHQAPIPFPLGNWRKDFVAAFRTAQAQLDELPPSPAYLS